MTRAVRNLNTRILKGFLSDFTQEVFGKTDLHPRNIPAFFDKARDSDLIALSKYMDSFTSELDENPGVLKRKALSIFVESIVAS